MNTYTQIRQPGGWALAALLYVVSSIGVLFSLALGVLIMISEERPGAKTETEIFAAVIFAGSVIGLISAGRQTKKPRK